MTKSGCAVAGLQAMLQQPSVAGSTLCSCAPYPPKLSSVLTPLCALLPFPLSTHVPCRGQYLYQPSFGMYSNIILPCLIGFVICSMILATGPTGFAGNPARDLVSTKQLVLSPRCSSILLLLRGHRTP